MARTELLLLLKWRLLICQLEMSFIQLGRQEGQRPGGQCVCVSFLFVLGRLLLLHFLCVSSAFCQPPLSSFQKGVSSVDLGDQSCVVRFFVGRVVSVGESGVLRTTLSSPAQKGIRSSRLDQQRKRELPSAGCWIYGRLEYMAHRVGGLVGSAEEYLGIVGAGMSLGTCEFQREQCFELLYTFSELPPGPPLSNQLTLVRLTLFSWSVTLASFAYHDVECDIGELSCMRLDLVPRLQF